RTARRADDSGGGHGTRGSPSTGNVERGTRNREGRVDAVPEPPLLFRVPRSHFRVSRFRVVIAAPDRTFPRGCQRPRAPVPPSGAGRRRVPRPRRAPPRTCAPRPARAGAVSGI